MAMVDGCRHYNCLFRRTTDRSNFGLAAGAFCVHQMNQVNTCNGSTMTTAPQTMCCLDTLYFTSDLAHCSSQLQRLFPISSTFLVVTPRILLNLWYTKTFILQEEIENLQRYVKSNVRPNICHRNDYVEVTQNRTGVAEMEQHSPSTVIGVENIQLQHIT